MDQVPTQMDKRLAPADAGGWTTTIDLARATRVDGRTYLARGEDPLTAILAAAAAVPIGDDLVVDAPFDPVPLRQLLASRGFLVEARELEAGHWRAYFRRLGPDPTPGTAPPEVRCWRIRETVHLNVRGLPPPEPMLEVLRLIEGPNAPSFVVVHHDREPIYLYPELVERGWRYRVEHTPAGEVLITLERGSP